MVQEQCRKIKTTNKAIALYLPNSIQYVIVFFSILCLDKTILPLSTNLKHGELLEFLKLGEISYLITNNVNYKKLKDNADFSNIIIYNIDSEETTLAYIENETITEKDEILDDVAVLLPTSGSTGQSKLVMLTHDNLICNICANIESLSITENDVTYISLPMCYGYCNTAQFLSHIYVGGTIVIQSSIMYASTMIMDLKSFKVTNYFCNPTIINILVEYLKLYTIDLSDLRSIFIGTAAIAKSKLEKLIKLLPSTNIYLTYGLTEASPRVTTYLVDKNNIKSSIGKPLIGIDIRIIDDNGVDVQIGQVGQLIIRGKNIMKGYYSNVEATERVVIDGWLYTGDCALFDQDNNIFIKGRKKNIINCSGCVIYPEEIEEVLNKHDAIKDVYVYGQPHDIYGEIAVADIVLLDGINEKMALHSIKTFCVKNLSNNKIPKICVVCSIPKTISNKIKRTN